MSEPRPATSLPCQVHPMATLIGTRQVGMGVVETYRCDGGEHTFEVRSWAEALDTGFADDREDDD